MAAKARVLDFTNVKERQFNIKRLPEGDYPAKVKSVEFAKSKAGNPQWLFTIEVTGGSARGRGATYPYYCTLDTDSLWKIRNLWAAVGINIPKKRANIDPNKVVGRPLAISLEDDEYEGKLKSIIGATIPLSDLQPHDDDEDGDDETEDETEDSDDEDEDEEPAPKKKKTKPVPPTDTKAKKKKKADDDDEELEELEIEDL